MTYGGKQDGDSRNFLNDILWGQYCLFLFVRIQDDLFDGQADSPSLLFASDQFLFEAECTFSNHFRCESPFWDIYRRCLQSTTRAIVYVDRLQQTQSSSPQKLLAEYAWVCAIFKVGSVAICAKFNRMKDFTRVAAFADEMAIAGQILDDLEDIEEDLQRKRFNYTTTFLLHYPKKRKSPRNETLRQIAENLLFTNVATKLFLELQRRLELADEALRPLQLMASRKYLRFYRQSLDNMENQLHRQRVKLLFDGT